MMIRALSPLFRLKPHRLGVRDLYMSSIEQEQIDSALMRMSKSLKFCHWRASFHAQDGMSSGGDGISIFALIVFGLPIFCGSLD